MEAYRDQYATLFKNGQDVVVIAISVDPDTTLASWAREKSFPMLFASDSAGTVGRAYNSHLADKKLDDRSLFVIAPDGKVAYVTRPFRVLAQDAYTELGAAVSKASAGTAQSH